MAPNLNGPPNNNIAPEGPDPFNLIFAKQFEWAPNNNIDPRGPGPFNLIFPTNLKMPPTIIFKWPPI